MKYALENILREILSEMGFKNATVVVNYSGELIHGDYTTNVAMGLARDLKRNPLDIAKEIVSQLEIKKISSQANRIDLSTAQTHQKSENLASQNSILQDMEKIVVAPPGFINFYLTSSALSKQIGEVLQAKEAYGKGQSEAGKKIMVEFAHPNTHKAFHIGHLRNITTGEAIVRLLESQGVQVIRVNYQGDVGMHIAKCIYGIFQSSKFNAQIFVQENKNKSPQEKAELLGKMYAVGSKAFEESDEVKGKIKDINKQIYTKSDTDVSELYVETRQWSLDYFETIYTRVGTTFNRYYFESEFAQSGSQTARDALKMGILTESEGAIIFNGKQYGLDTRVFINSLGLPTYEGKELGLAKKELSEFGHIDQIIHVVGPEQASFFKVTFKVEELLDLQKNQQRHLVYGWVKLKHGKMSSRTGNVVLGEWLLDELEKEITNILLTNKSNYTNEDQVKIAKTSAVAAVKYAFLKVGTAQEIAFDIKESVNINGDSGPYLLYTYARAKSVMRKAKDKQEAPRADSKLKLNVDELLVLRLIYRFTDMVADASKTLSPSLIASYLYKLSSSFNSFYNSHSILSDENANVRLLRLGLTAATAQVIKNGLYLLGIETLEQM